MSHLVLIIMDVALGDRRAARLPWDVRRLQESRRQACQSNLKHLEQGMARGTSLLFAKPARSTGLILLN